MSSTTTPTSASASTSTCAGPTMYELPIEDAACGIPNNADYKTTFESCAYPATVQSVQDLIDCLYEARVDWGDVWCTGGTDTTATGKYKIATATPTSTSTSSSKAAEETGFETDDPNGAVAARAPGSGVVALGLLALLLTGFGGPV
ncbi:hypothetical protein BDW75DRAFT_233318 [Aspergillus navahoensis]